MKGTKLRYSHKKQWHYIVFDGSENLRVAFEKWENIGKTTEFEWWTGIRDENKKEIYQGDVDKNGMIVTYCGDQVYGLGMNVGWYLQTGDFEHWIELESRHNDNDDNHLIVGNIHNIPEA